MRKLVWRGIALKYKIVVGVLVLALMVSLGFNVYYYRLTSAQQATINNMRGYIVLSWARLMNDISFYLLDVTTNDDVFKVRPLLFVAGENVAISADVSDGGLYIDMAVTSSTVYEDLLPYEENSTHYTTQFVRLINPDAVEMIKTLAHKIQNTAGLLIGEWFDLTNREGVDPLQLLEEKDVLDSVISGLDDIRSQSGQIYNFTPKFQ